MGNQSFVANAETISYRVMAIHKFIAYVPEFRKRSINSERRIIHRKLIDVF